MEVRSDSYSFTSEMKYSEGLEELQKSTKRISKQLEHEARMLFGNRREHLVMSHDVVIDVASFLIGGIGSVAVGFIADETCLDEEGSGTGLFANCSLRGLSPPMKYAIRFLSGGCIYVAVDSLIYNVHHVRLPLACGALTGMCFVNRVWSNVSVSSVLGMAVFSHIADGAYEKLVNSLF